MNINEHINITGTIAVDQANVPISISYKNTTDTAWNSLATVNTDPQGNFTYAWTPSISGQYDIKATGVFAGSPQTSTTLSIKVNSGPQLPWIYIGLVAAAVIIIALLALLYYQRRK